MPGYDGQDGAPGPYEARDYQRWHVTIDGSAICRNRRNWASSIEWLFWEAARHLERTDSDSSPTRQCLGDLTEKNVARIIAHVLVHLCRLVLNEVLLRPADEWGEREGPAP